MFCIIEIVKENKFDQKVNFDFILKVKVNFELITDFKDYSQESNQKLEEIKSSFDVSLKHNCLGLLTF